MGRYTPAARALVCVVALAGATTLFGVLRPGGASLADWLLLGVLAACAAAAHRFPIGAADGHANFVVTNVLLICGALTLPISIVALLPIVALAPASWFRRHAAGEWVRWLFNTSQATLATVAAAALWSGVAAQTLRDGRDLVIALSAGVVFVAVQSTLVSVVIALQSRTPLLQAAPFSRPALEGELTKAVLAVIVAALWLNDPVVLVVAPILLVLAYRLTRTAHLAHMAEVDAKTGLHNARYFERALETELANARRTHGHLAVLFADLDHFKSINDRLGHDNGDRVLQQVATLLRDQVRRGDLVARFGGEEFVVLLPGADAQRAYLMAERLRTAIGSHRFELGPGQPLQCTISIGIAVYPEDGQQPGELRTHADAGMYRAKATRNAVARAPASTPEHLAA